MHLAEFELANFRAFVSAGVTSRRDQSFSSLYGRPTVGPSRRGETESCSPRRWSNLQKKSASPSTVFERRAFADTLSVSQFDLLCAGARSAPVVTVWSLARGGVKALGVPKAIPHERPASRSRIHFGPVRFGGKRTIMRYHAPQSRAVALVFLRP